METNFIFKETFDSVFSNAALHWMKPWGKVISCVEKSLKLAGNFVPKFGGKGNIKTIITPIQEVFEDNGYPWHPELNPWYFPSIGDYTN